MLHAPLKKASSRTIQGLVAYMQAKIAPRHANGRLKTTPSKTLTPFTTSTVVRQDERILAYPYLGNNHMNRKESAAVQRQLPETRLWTVSFLRLFFAFYVPYDLQGEIFVNIFQAFYG
jgi:hypothetical protein